MSRDYTTNRQFVAYGVFDELGYCVYVGSSEKELKTIEDNHRRFREKFPDDPSETTFRLALEREGADWKFQILKSTRCTRTEAEKIETLFINLCRPRYNVDMNPYSSSVGRGRITEDVDEYLHPVVEYIKQIS